MSMNAKSSEEILRECGIEPDPVIEYYKQFVDRDALRENLKLSVEERLLKMQERVREADRRMVNGLGC